MRKIDERQGRQAYPGNPMPTPKSTLTPEKPWAILGITRRQYAVARPWKKAGMTKEKYAEMLNLIPHEGIKLLREEAQAEVLVESIFKRL